MRKRVNVEVMPILFNEFLGYFTFPWPHGDHILQDVTPSPFGLFEIFFSIIPNMHEAYCIGCGFSA